MRAEVERGEPVACLKGGSAKKSTSVENAIFDGEGINSGAVQAEVPVGQPAERGVEFDQVCAGDAADKSEGAAGIDLVTIDGECVHKEVSFWIPWSDFTGDFVGGSEIGADETPGGAE